MESSRLKMEITQRNELLYKIDAETQMVEKVSFLCSSYSLGRNKVCFKGLYVIMNYTVCCFIINHKGTWMVKSQEN